MPLAFVITSSLIGLGAVGWLLWDARREWQRDQRRRQVRIDPAWHVDEERERLKAAAIWRGYRKEDVSFTRRRQQDR